MRYRRRRSSWVDSETARKMTLPEKDVSCKIRCNGKLHTIVLTPKGRVVLKDHPDLEAEKMLSFMGSKNKCLEFLEIWRGVARGNYDGADTRKKLPKVFKWVVNAVACRHRDRYRYNGDPDPLKSRMDDLATLEVGGPERLKRLGKFIMNHEDASGALNRVFLRELKKTPVYQAFSKSCSITHNSDPSLTIIDENNYSSSYWRRNDPICYWVNINSRPWNNEVSRTLQMCGRLPLSWYRLYKEGKHLVDGNLIITRSGNNVTSLRLLPNEAMSFYVGTMPSQGPLKLVEQKATINEKGRLIWEALPQPEPEKKK